MNIKAVTLGRYFITRRNRKKVSPEPTFSKNICMSEALLITLLGFPTFVPRHGEVGHEREQDPLILKKGMFREQPLLHFVLFRFRLSLAVWTVIYQAVICIKKASRCSNKGMRSDIMSLVRVNNNTTVTRQQTMLREIKAIRVFKRVISTHILICLRKQLLLKVRREWRIAFTSSRKTVSLVYIGDVAGLRNSFF